MITEEKLTIYEKYGGQVDAWARAGVSDEKRAMSDNDWYLIDDLIQDIIIGMANIDTRILENTENESTALALRELAKKI